MLAAQLQPDPPRFAILLLPGARLSSWGVAVDALHHINRMLASLFQGRTARKVVVVTLDGGAVRLAHGPLAAPRFSIDDVPSARAVYVADFEAEGDDDRERLDARSHDRVRRWLSEMYEAGAVVAGAAGAASVVAESCLGGGGVAALPYASQVEARRRLSGLRLAPEDSVVEDRGVLTAGTAARELELLYRLINRAMSTSAARWFAKQTGLVIIDTSMMSPDEVDSADALVARAQQWIRERYWQSFNVDEVAGEFAVSARTLTRRFNKSLAKSPHQFVVEVRIEAAKRLMARTELSMAEVAGLVGYPDLKHFRQVFLAYAGCSPAQYRKTMAGAPHESLAHHEARLHVGGTSCVIQQELIKRPRPGSLRPRAVD